MTQQKRKRKHIELAITETTTVIETTTTPVKEATVAPASNKKMSLSALKLAATLKDFVPPSNWSEQFAKLKLWRFSYRDATETELQFPKEPPVDRMGCSLLNLASVPPAVRRYQILVSLMLSSQTRDECTAQAIENLHVMCNKTQSGKVGLCIDKVLKQEPSVLTVCIKPVGFHNVKTKTLIKISQICHDEYDGDIPRTYGDLCKLPGIGPKMAHLTMTHAWHDTQGIGVDTHVHRIS